MSWKMKADTPAVGSSHPDLFPAVTSGGSEEHVFPKVPKWAAAGGVTEHFADSGSGHPLFLRLPGGHSQGWLPPEAAPGDHRAGGDATRKQLHPGPAPRGVLAAPALPLCRGGCLARAARQVGVISPRGRGAGCMHERKSLGLSQFHFSLT